MVVRECGLDTRQLGRREYRTKQWGWGQIAVWDLRHVVRSSKEERTASSKFLGQGPKQGETQNLDKTYKVPICLVPYFELSIEV